MSCDRPLSQLYLYLDGELAPPEALEVEQHLHTCHACQEEVAAHRRLQALLRTTLSDAEMPEQLWTAIQYRMAQETLAMGQDPSGWLRCRLWISLGTLAVLLLIVLSVQLWRTPTIPVVVQEIVDSQIRARLMGVPYHQIPADQEAIQRWFDDKVEFAVLVPVLPPERYAFLGVRLNYFLNRRVAEMAYASGSHVLSFFMFSDKGLTVSAMRTIHLGNKTLYVQTHQGYTTVFWQDGELFCGLVSDLRLIVLMDALRHASGAT
jgi:mycothiol system anti-sigma-R factor